MRALLNLRSKCSRLRRNRFTGFWLPFVLSVFFCSGCEEQRNKINPETQLAAMIFSRSTIGEVKSFRDKEYMHGLSFFYFHLLGNDADRLVAWLKMKEQKSIPPPLSDRVRAASEGAGWKFNWQKSKIYVTYYCHPFDGTYWSVDLLLVDKEAGVFVTEGYLPPASSVTDNPRSCETQ